MTTELSNAPTAWTRDLRETLSETRTTIMNFSDGHACIQMFGYGSRREGPEDRPQGLILLCHCPQVAALRERSTERAMAGEGVYLASFSVEFENA